MLPISIATSAGTSISMGVAAAADDLATVAFDDGADAGGAGVEIGHLSPLTT